MAGQVIKEQCADCGAGLSVYGRGNRYQNDQGEDICDPCYHAMEDPGPRRSRGQYGPRETVEEQTFEALREFNEATAEQIAQELGIPYSTAYRRLVRLMEKGRATRRKQLGQIFLIGHPPYYWRVI